MDYPQEDEDLLLQEELEMMKSGEIGYAANASQHHQFLTREEEQEIFNSMHSQNSIGLSGKNAIHDTSTNVSTAENKSANFGGISGIQLTAGGPVNRRLFEMAPVSRVTSTPFIEKGKSVNNGVEVVKEPSKRLRFDRDIFGVDLHENESYADPLAKKMKIEEDHDLETIDKILALRQRIGASSTRVYKGNDLYLQRLHEYKKKNLSYAVPQWPFLPLRRTEHERIFVRFHSAEYETRSIQDMNVKSSNECLLGNRKQDLWNEANDIISKRLEQRLISNTEIVENAANGQELEENLWVEKYKPRKYVDLLSAETTNRSLLLWLKMWDKVVFGRDFTPKSNLSEVTHKLNTFNKRTGKFESNGGWFQRRSRTNFDASADEYGRPVQKVALLYGAPGLGKTTLAHILARHAGYQPLELNASDDRSPASFQQALENGTQMASVLNEDRRPNCIILDEIDGAPRQSIEFLVKFISDGFHSKRTKGEGKAKNILKRPIICICNDIYESAAMRSLRLVAFIVQFPPIQVSRLEERLKQIAKQERLKADITALYALAQKTGNDVRSCISTLQFFKAKENAINLQDVINNSVSRKDQHQGLFTVWAKIFQIQKTVENKNSLEDSLSNANETVRVRNILDSVQAAGDYQRLMSGVYENFLNQKLPDSNFSGVVDALQWFCFTDSIQYKISNQQNYAIYPYIQFGFAKWHLLFATLMWPKINFPTKGIELNQKRATQNNIFDALRKGLFSSAGIKTLGLSGKSILMEAVPFLKKIISPDLRHLPVELYSQRERQDLAHTIDIMADLGLTYIQVKSLDGTYQFRMEPDLEALIKLPGFPGVNISYFGRQMLSREVEIERIRRASPKVSGPLNKNVTKTDPRPKENQIPNHLRKLQPKMPVDTGRDICAGNAISKYFGNNFISNSKQSSSSHCKEKTEDPIVKSPIWYHYKEGFNNAVRKDILLLELL